MRFVSAHKLTSYLMVACAFFALGFSGELNPVMIGLALLAMAGSWVWEAPRVRLKRWATVWAVLSLLVLGYTLLRAFLGGDFLIVGVEYLIFLLIAKLYNRAACRDYLHIYVLTFLMLVAGTVLNPEITYGVFFLGYVVSTTWALILFHLRREMEENFLLRHTEDRESEPVQVTRILNSRRIVNRRFFVGTALVSLGVFAAATLMFLAIPRIGFGLFSQNRRGGISMAGFSDQVELGGHGTIKSDNTVVMRVKIDRSFRSQETRPLYWRGVSFDAYNEGRWARSRFAPRTSLQSVYGGPGVQRYHMLYAADRNRLSEYQFEDRMREAVRQEIYLEPISEDVLFGASMPATFELTERPGPRRERPQSTRNDEMRFSHGTGIKYVVYSQIHRPDTEALRAAPASVPPGYEVYAQQVPPELPERVEALAREITKDATTNYDKAAAIEAWLESNLTYTLEMRSPGDEEPIAFFLFDRKQGHCEYFASAMTIMLRTVGVPARNVNGFLGGEWNEYDEYLAVRARDAHSWVEVYFEGLGWVTFDPTPSSGAGAEEEDDDGLAGRMRRFLDTVRFQWFQWVIEYDLRRQMSLFRGVGDSVKSGGTSVKELFAGVRDWLGRHGPLVGGLFLGGALMVTLLTRWRRRTGAQRIAGARDPMSAIYRQAVLSLARRGHDRAPAVTPREHAAELAARAVPGAAALVELTDLYYARIYGGRDEPELLDRARGLAADIERALREAPASADPGPPGN
jgi:transglutaminase-like putative cysteine protease